MPEATVNKDNFFAGRKNQIGFSGKVLSVKPEAVQLQDKIVVRFALTIYFYSLCFIRYHPAPFLIDRERSGLIEQCQCAGLSQGGRR